MSDAVEVADGFRDRLATLAAEYGKFKLVPDLPAPSRESYSKFTDPVDELFNRLGRMEPPIKILEGLIIPKTMKGAREAWVFIVPLLVGVGIAIVLELPAAGHCRPGRDRAGGRWPAADLAASSFPRPSSSGSTTRSCNRWPTPTD